MKRLIGLLIVVILLSACSKPKDKVTISAAASLTDALEEVKTKFNEQHEDIELEFNFGGSGALREQIKQGAPVDMVIFASLKDFELLGETETFVNEDVLLENTLVLVAPAHNQTIQTIDDLRGADKIAVGTAESVPAGKYAEQAFNSLDLTGAIEDKFIYAEDVRAVLQYVAQDEVDAGVVYKTDALTENRVKIIDTFDADTHDKIVYPVGTLTNNEATELFYEFLQTKEAKDIFVKYGFTVE